MPMKLDGSCQCGGVQFNLQSNTPVPYQLCACSICRKISGFSGSINIGGITETLVITRGKDLIRVYHAIKDRGTPKEEQCNSNRSFCSHCSTMLWVWDKQWPELIHPFAPAIDTELPIPPRMVCIMNSSRPSWVRWPDGDKEIYETYGPESLEGWHKKNNVWYE